MQGAAFALSPAGNGILHGRSSRRGCGRHSSGFGAVKVRASSVPESAGEGSPSPTEAKPAGEGLLQTLQLGGLFGLWYLFNIYFNIFNKQVLVFSCFISYVPLYIHINNNYSNTICCWDYLRSFMWTTSLLKKPKISSSQVVAILPLAIVHTMGNLFTNMSLGKVAVSFTHTIKAMEPFFSVILSAMFLGETPSLLVVLSLAPIVGGVALASLTEVSFNWAGFWSAMASNVTFQSRNVLSKKFMVKKEESLDNISLFSIITILSCFLLAPVALFVEGVKFTPAYLQSAGLNVNEIYVRSLVASLCFHAYQQVSYMILSKVTPVTHSVGNCVKRVVVIVTSVFFFRTPHRARGVFLYSWVKRLKPKKLKSA
ncbi:unnamed protein product [Spirodela intermedia]|uniref:Sugar phosphate transporter domain-containing protein n=1 Tax=Spirodela intermedia TaxID=51605 RepID=A0A7I8ITT6_SPIIN|nr:unnamed protein product [Spirodela intermedia]CAA6661216.1 unnamed protein product [Spirodela intermedia]